MATIRRRGNKYQAQIRKDGYKTVSRTFSSVSVARSWAKAVEADMERNLYLCTQENVTIGKLLDQYHKEVSQTQRSVESTTYMLQTLSNHFREIAIFGLTPMKIAQYRVPTERHYSCISKTRT